MWRSLNSVLGNKKENLACQVQDGERIISEPKAVASKFNKFFATTGCCIAKKLGSASREEVKKYESVIQADGECLCDLQCVRSGVRSKSTRELDCSKYQPPVFFLFRPTNKDLYFKNLKMVRPPVP